MRKYEIMCVFAPQDEAYTKGLESVKKELADLGAKIEKEENMGVKQIAGAIKSHTHAHYLYFIASLEPDKAHLIRKHMALIPSLLRILVTRLT